MKKLVVLCSLFACASFMTGCGVMPMKGTSHAAITIDHMVSDPVIDNNVRPAKMGMAKATAIILFNSGDASIDAAMRNGGITKVHHVNYDVKNILFLFNEVTTIVYGE